MSPASKSIMIAFLSFPLSTSYHFSKPRAFIRRAADFPYDFDNDEIWDTTTQLPPSEDTTSGNGELDVKGIAIVVGATMGCFIVAAILCRVMITRRERRIQNEEQPRPNHKKCGMMQRIRRLIDRKTRRQAHDSVDLPLYMSSNSHCDVEAPPPIYERSGKLVAREELVGLWKEASVYELAVFNYHQETLPSV